MAIVVTRFIFLPCFLKRNFCTATLTVFQSWMLKCFREAGLQGNDYRISKVKNKTQKGHLSIIKLVAQLELYSSVCIMDITLLRLLPHRISVALSLH